MRQLFVMVAAVAALASVAACGPDKATETVRSGSYCRQAGATAKTDAGRPMVCATTGTDKRLRWRAR